MAEAGIRIRTSRQIRGARPPEGRAPLRYSMVAPEASTSPCQTFSCARI